MSSALPHRFCYPKEGRCLKKNITQNIGGYLPGQLHGLQADICRAIALAKFLED
ncbi:hypothetical protein AFE_2001 [Acidithiobacillus ferrooxidans ATCC 23270]|uniref:Uncharacterized protein n=1 Tax=Acidithiobacillus ferrooxidans (strain ATCC 23270 / DSM 14882 / CIP 104768 / NCIMB 8455) TaxID=243159 RepID=B7JC95_ACIF2|nr:hypothetical protein AFE_2001 [Acidithiobacillus ferrooxidans ATCC 23270]